MKILHLTLNRKWFDMIASGEKTEEYREIKPYWFARLAMCSGKSPIPHGYTCKKDLCSSCIYAGGFTEKPYSIVKFRHGYSKNAPTITFRMNEIRVTTGFKEWGAEPGKKYFVIKLGEKIK